MRCKKHNTDLTSITGVCATCLRERLFTLILYQEQSQTQSLQHNNCNSNSNPPPNSTHRRSVSPYITGRKLTNSLNPAASLQRPYNKPRLNHSLSDRRFYNSPQIAINTGGCIGSSSFSSNSKKPNLIRFPSISKLFRSNSRNSNGDVDSNPRVSVSNCTESSSTITSTVRKQRCVRNRGMSPVRSSDDGEFSDGSSGYETCKQTPINQTVRRGGGENSVTETILCPLVRASPNRLLNVKGKTPVDGQYSGDVGAPAVPHIRYVKSFGGNRSRKVADFGRNDPNR
ncbi:hypothetical protein QVD17_33334 [Tagetes erecta]|uniref:Uncharacterized protein n=1 Tax=Tagetes erecta TaxID=13708 RepID=A0AAD8NDX1_TARER|nr:hypothetical protein QVD17_33334 [Tagetes erecta]